MSFYPMVTRRYMAMAMSNTSFVSKPACLSPLLPPPTRSARLWRMVSAPSLHTSGACVLRACLPAAALKCSLRNVAEESEEERLFQAKFSLLNAVQDISRGLKASLEQRSCIEEAMVAVECFDACSPLDLKMLNGTWLLQYTTALDVLWILQAAELPIFKVGQILQKFECSDSLDGGLIQNIVRWSVKGLLQEDDGATLTVTAQFSLVTARNIALQFQEAALGGILISEQLQGLLAPAILPRTFLNLQILQFIRSFNAQIPLLNGGADATQSVPPGSLYYLSYLDNDMLLGRSVGGGVFIFSKTQPFQIL